RWPSPSATSTPGRSGWPPLSSPRGPGQPAGPHSRVSARSSRRTRFGGTSPPSRASGRSSRRPRFGATSALNPYARDRVPARQHPRKTSEQNRRRRQRHRLRGVRAAVDVLRPRRRRFGHRGADSHACARGRAPALRFRHPARAGAVRAADQRQRHRPQGRARGAFGHRAARPDSRHRARRSRAPHCHPRRRQENCRAHRPRAERSAAAPAGGGDCRRRCRARRSDCARRGGLVAREPGVSSAARRESRRRRLQDDRTVLRPRLRAHLETGVTGSGQVTDDRMVTAARVDDDAQYEAGLRPRRLDDYIGQDRIRENLQVAIAAAKQRKEPLDHVLLHGPPGLGKTTLAYIIGNEMGVPVRATSGPAIEKPGDLVGIVTNLAEKEVLFIDEIHRMPPAVEEILYPALEDYEVDIVIGQGPSARTVKMRLERFTLIGATTRTGLLTSPLRSRFGIVHRLEFYTPADLEEIVRRSAKILDVPIDDAAAAEIAGRARGTPRIVNRLLRRVRDYAQVRADGAITLEVARKGLGLLEVDEHGFDEIDRKLLRTIIDKFSGGPVGLNTIAAAISEEKDAIEDIYEPFL